MMNLVREGRKNKIDDKDIWNSVLSQRWTSDVFDQESPCIDESKIYQVIVKAAQELNLTIGLNGWIPEGDLIFGAKLYSLINYCPAHLVEAAKLSVFFESLLVNQSLETMVLATINSIQPRAGDTIKDFTSINMWYEKLDEKFNFSIGPIIVALSTANQLTQLEQLDPPFLKNVSASSIMHDYGQYQEFGDFPGDF